MPVIVYDSTCPVCTEFKRLIQKKLGDRVEYRPVQKHASDFEYIGNDGNSVYGASAIDVMVKEFPEIKDFMWILPEKYKVAGLKVAYKVGSVARKAIGAVKKGCNCGNH